jgi:Trk K+ transport system NAD-binding subunit
MDLLIDECVPASVTQVFAQRNHRIFYVTQELGQKTPDAVVARTANEQNLILLTWNFKDFRALLSRRPRHNQLKYRNSGLISFICPEQRGATRALQVIESIEFEYQQSLKRPDRRLIAVYVDELRVFY